MPREVCALERAAEEAERAGAEGRNVKRL